MNLALDSTHILFFFFFSHTSSITHLPDNWSNTITKGGNKLLNEILTRFIDELLRANGRNVLHVDWKQFGTGYQWVMSFLTTTGPFINSSLSNASLLLKLGGLSGSTEIAATLLNAHYRSSPLGMLCFWSLQTFFRIKQI